MSDPKVFDFVDQQGINDWGLNGEKKIKDLTISEINDINGAVAEAARDKMSGGGGGCTAMCTCAMCTCA